MSSFFTDLAAEHAIGGIIGLLFNGLFADGNLVALDNVNTSTPGGWIRHNWKQLYIQIAYIVACTAYSFVVSALIAFAIDKIPGLKLRASEEAELLGMDDDQLGEFAYDYVGLEQDLGVMDVEGGLAREKEHALNGGREPMHHPHTDDSSLEKPANSTA